jgi:UrcA family protein
MKYALSLALAALLVSGSARGEQAMVVKVRDLNLHTTAGAYVAIQRMNDAAAAFCSSWARNGVREMDFTTLKCRRDLVTRAAIKLGSPEVSYLQSQLGPTKVDPTAAPWRFSADAR